MPLPEPSEQEGESVKAGQEPSPKPGTDVIPAAPRKPREFSKLVLLTASDQDEDGVGSKPQEVHCVLSLEMAGPATLASTLQILPVEEQGGVVQPALEMPEQKCSKLDAAAPQSLEFLRTPFGGRLLVLESFLYKQEKAVGDKVYWKCRQHAELGCRGRAITRGLRATVMRGHCHAPDEQGLEARRQREKLPSLALPEGLGEPQGPEGPGGRVEEPLEGVGPWQCPEEPEPTPGLVLSKPALEEEEAPRALSLLSLPPKKRSILGLGQARPLEFLRTCYGGSFLVHESFLYKREKAVGDKVYWTCRDHALHGCRSRAITQGQRVTVMRGHCHQPDMEGLEARRQQEKAVETLQAGQDGPGSQVDTLLRGVDSLLYRRGPGPLTLTRPRPRKRAKVEDQELPTQPEAPDEHQDMDADPGGPEFLKTPLGGSFLVYESFLYRREKAAGEKVYWTCRDQARMGCRSRAITQGRRVTVMRGHCHPPDLGGLEALRQREKRPNTAQRGSPGGPEFLKTPLGGSFLVYESFLYRREKAAGEKVYWTCRDQARMGCRSRAITQGRRVMVMRRHCHPPDLGGLEALRQREHFPNLAQWDSPDPLRPLEFLRTSLGGRFLVHESFLYRKEKAAGEKVYWMCRDQARLGCRSRAITQGHRIMVMRSHCHQPDLAGLEALRQRERLPTTAQQEDPEKIQVQLCFKTCSPESQQIYGDIKDVRLDGESQ
ncbi:FLYWCH-type zinc finger 1 [Homo sapiens]|uniref:FLYWCH-type zinc finger-containing protein 1 n=3 Tax=Homo sapiens TaxID=9606 RepID=FWCH1_HUMAN|nr:FLYWCH-type zinc finger-containing protein 1 isoform c [Homo sapiens]XP_047290734.1 FLYWCH-type zinc finger-containing protein 1 isoform X8 [Homo sapiens]XP_047290735.1 FLYWCH-type zinc finger-containing protein 1 isoform X8 [Homo sapiens]XP_047290736.1 FLYWCH-type zinc finger-containing protein 1 isoform X8 [Homo sapiens]XP_047290737.1 FLYWCH-type zinc finger-containing protein 1 isoform X8 [Homo sapiens]XP_054170144.1 FLYWCH-type zinc finger-containing protein 1 isoform X8 [Homo sapiens]|eukprot:NP_001294997.1 FLYWCH-type zinc finger-containing protein 1 isoform c [Homo sapiens]